MPRTYRRVRCQRGRLLALVRAAGDPHRTRLPPTAAQFAPRGNHARGNFEVEFQVACHAHPACVGAQCHEARGIGRCLRADRDVSGQRFTDQRRNPAIAAHRPVGDPCARNHERHVSSPDFPIERRPDFRLEHDRHARTDAIEEPPRCSRKIVGQVAVADLGAEDRPCPLGAGRGHRGDHDVDPGHAPLQFFYQRSRSLDLTHRNGVDPGAARLRLRRHEPEPLLHASALRGIAQLAPAFDGDHDRRNETGEQQVEDAQSIHPSPTLLTPPIPSPPLTPATPSSSHCHSVSPKRPAGRPPVTLPSDLRSRASTRPSQVPRARIRPRSKSST